MTRTKYFRTAIFAAAVLAASGCSVLQTGGHTNTPVLGQRIPVLTGEGDVAVDPALESIAVTLPPAVENSEWSQSGGNATKSMGQLALGSSVSRAFTVQAGRGNSLAARLAAAPIVADGRVFTTDTLGTVRAFDGRTGAAVWSSQTPTDKGKQSACDTEKKTIQTAEEAYYASQQANATYDTTANLVTKHFLADTPVNYTVTTADSTGYTISALSTSPNGCT